MPLKECIESLTLSAPSRKRHERYCRTKPAIVSRRRACASCIKAKVRCEPSTPGCLRCVNRNISCYFEQNIDIHLPENSLTETTSSIQPNIFPSLPFQFSSQGIEIDDGAHQVQTTFQELIPEYSQDIPEILCGWDGFQFQETQPRREYLLMPSDMHLFTLFSPLPCTNINSMVPITMATGIIRSYPDMMAKRTTFPPFIHATCCTGDTTSSMPASLANAMSISQLFRQRTNYSQDFIWRSIQSESQRITEEVYKLMDCSPWVANCVTAYHHGLSWAHRRNASNRNLYVDEN
jgi:hypothetical protein